MAESSMLEFKAGKMSMSGSTVTADKRKGLVCLRNLDGMTALVWKDRSTGKEDQPIILFPDDATFRKCKSSPSGRVFYLKFSNDRRDFFWMQDLSPTNDEVYCKKLNDIINGHVGGEETSELQSAIAAADPQGQASLRRMFGVEATPASSSTVAATPAAAAAVSTPSAPARTQPPALSDERSRQLVAALASQVASMQGPDIDLTHVLAPENLEPILSDPAVVAELATLLPDGPASSQYVLENVRSPQYAQALASFSGALQTGQLDDVMRQFGVDPSVVRGAGGGARGLCAAIEQLVKKEKGEGGDRMDEGDSSA